MGIGSDVPRLRVGRLDEALLLESQILALDPPLPRAFKFFKSWFFSDSLPVLWGQDEHLFDKERDLVALATYDTDRLNNLLITYLGWLFKVNLSRLREERSDRL